MNRDFYRFDFRCSNCEALVPRLIPFGKSVNDYENDELTTSESLFTCENCGCKDYLDSHG